MASATSQSVIVKDGFNQSQALERLSLFDESGKPLDLSLNKTVRITVPLTGGGINVSAVGAIQDWTQRLLICLPLTTSRWRIRARNITPLNDLAGTGPVNCQGVWKGEPSFTAQRWNGVFSATPTLVVPAFALSSGGAADVATDWVYDPVNQFVGGQLSGLSFGFIGDGTTSFRFETPHQALYSAGAGNAALAGGAALPAIGGVSTLGTMDMRLEYEAVVPATTPVILTIGDSITQGAPGGDLGAYPHETWPGSMALRKRRPVINLGASSTTLNAWQFGTGWRWSRADLTTTIPDKAIVALGTNDLASTSTVNEGRLATLITNVKSIGIKEVWVCTVIPYVGGLGNEPNRTAFNAVIRDVPRGVAGVIDFDAALRVDAAQSTADPQWVSTYPHPLRAGYQRMAAEVP